jgi:uncharacterized membrane protein
MVEILLLILAVAFFARRGRGGSTGASALPALLRGAEEAGIITATQREQLLAFAGARDTASGRLGGAGWLGVFAGLFVVAGVSLLIARNWDQIGPLVRVAAYLVVLAAVGIAAIRARERALAFSLPLELLWLFLPLLGIGLYGQTFQLTGDPITPFLVWLVLTAPLAWLSPRPVAATVHTFAMVAVLFSGNFLVEPVTGLFGAGVVAPRNPLALTADASSASAWALSTALLACIAVQSLWLLPRAHRHHCVGVALCWVFAVLVAPTPFRLRHEGWIIVAALGLATLWVVALLALETSLEERVTSLFVWLAIVYGLTFTWHMDRAASGDTTAGGTVVAGATVLAAFAGAALLPARRLSPWTTWALTGRVLLVAPLAVALLYLGGDVRQVWLAAVVMNVLLLAIAVASMWHGSLVREPAQVNLGVVVLVGLLITRFLDVFGSMLRSGIGFIVAGLALAALSWALERTRRRLIAGVPEATP